MKMNTLWKNANRLIVKTRERFASLMAIVMIGTAFFTGVFSISTVMSQSVNDYNDEMNLKDITLYSNYGFDEDDVKAVSAMDSVETAEGTNFLDVYATYDNRTRITRLHSYGENDLINHFVLTEGRMPRNEHEAIAEKGTVLIPGFPIGSTVTFRRPDDDLGDFISVDQVTVVGICQTPLYLSITKGPSTLSNQTISTYLYLPEKAFTTDYYTEMNVLIKDGKTYDEFSQEYLDYAESIKEEMKAVAAEHEDARREKVQEEAREKWDESYAEYEDGRKKYEDGLQEYNDGKERYDREIRNAEVKLSDARAELSSGRAQIADGERTLKNAEAELVQARTDYTKQIEDGKAQLADGYRQLEDGKRELSEKEAEFLGLRDQLSEALDMLNSPILNASTPLKEYLSYLPSDESRALVQAVLRYCGFNPDRVTIGDITGYLNGNFNCFTIARMNRRIEEVMSSEAFTMIIQEDGETEGDLKELLDKIDQEKREDEKKSAEKKAEEEILEEETESEKEESLSKPEEKDNADLNQAISEETNTAPADQPEKEEQADKPPAQAEESQPEVPEAEITEQESASDPEPQAEKEADPEAPPNQAAKESVPEVIAETPSESDLEIQPEAMEMRTTSIASAESYISNEYRSAAPSNVKKITRAGSDIVMFSDLVSVMGFSDPTFAQLVRIMPRHDMPVEEGIALVNADAELLALSGQTLLALMNQQIPEWITVGTIVQLYPDLAELRDSLGLTDSSTIADVKAAVASAIDEIDSGLAEGRQQLAEAEALLWQKSNELAEGEAELNRRLSEGQQQISDGWAEIASSRIKLMNGEREYQNGYAEYLREKEDGSKKLIDASAELEDAKAELEEGKTKLDDALVEIEEMAEGEWMILDRSMHQASATYKSTVEQMAAIAKIFPVFFIAVAALVCLTTMTRLVNEERGQIGIFRALGYDRSQCSFTYLYYAGLASLIGTSVGSVAGLLIFPGIIYNTWRMLYILPDISYRIPWLTIIATAIAFFLMMEAVTAYVLFDDMNETPAAMLRPKAPKVGKEILLEKIPAIWNRLTFSWKVTARNIARYKQRVFMTVLGIAGCTALLVTGFGISDSINDIVNLQFNEISSADAIVSLKEEYQTPEKTAEVIRRLKEIEGTKSLDSLIYYNGKVHNAKEQEEVAVVRVFPDIETMKKQFNMRDRVSHRPVEPEEGSVIITEKLAENFGLHVGDEIEVEGIDGETAKVPVGGIMELYVYHNILMTENTYRDMFGTVPAENALCLSAENPSDDAYRAAVAGTEGVEAVEFNSSIIDNFSSMIKGINGVVLVLVISSMALAFVVLSNLTNVNISERLREIATLKVLGFRQKEVQNYIFKENMILVAFGALCGLPIGNYLAKYIMQEIELTNVMFGRQPGVLTFLYAFCLTIVFGLIVNFFMRGKLDQIQMVESLKSVE